MVTNGLICVIHNTTIIPNFAVEINMHKPITKYYYVRQLYIPQSHEAALR